MDAAEAVTHDGMAALLVGMAGVYADDLKAFPGEDPRRAELELLALYAFTVDFSIQVLMPKGRDANLVLGAYWTRLKGICDKVSPECWNSVQARVTAYATAVNSRRSENYVADIGAEFSRGMGRTDGALAPQAASLHATRARAVDNLLKVRRIAPAA